MPVRWIPNFSVSALHTAYAVSNFPTQITDSSLIEAIGPYAKDLNRWRLDSSPVVSEWFWNTLIASAAEIDSNFDLIATVLQKLGCFADHATLTKLAGFITDIEAAFKQKFPKFLEQVALRVRPLQEHWLGFSGGLIAHIGRLTDRELIPEEARIFPVQPILGGYGAAHLQSNMVRIEAMLTNPLAEIPEVVRLVWLVVQLQLELPRFSESLGLRTIQKIAPLAMLPPTLAAAQVLEIAQCTNDVIALAIEHWYVAIPSGRSIQDDIVPALTDWWETYLVNKPTWSVALQALDKILAFDNEASR